MNNAFPLAAKVRFTQKRLYVLTPRDRQNLAGRIGITQTDGALVRKPTVYFPADGVNPELRLFRVDPSHLELIEAPSDTKMTPSLINSKNGSDTSHGTADVEPSTFDGGGKLSQSEMDSLFG